MVTPVTLEVKMCELIFHIDNQQVQTPMYIDSVSEVKSLKKR